MYAGGYISSAGAVAMTTNRGASWVQTATAPADTVTGLCVHPTDPARVFAATTGGLHRSTNAGATWQRILTGRGLRAVVPCPGSSDSLVAGGDQGVWRSTDAGGSWQEMNEGLDVRAVNCLAFGGPGLGGLYAGTAGGAVYVYSFPTAVQEPPAVTPTAVRSPTIVRGVLMLPAPSFKPQASGRLLDAAGRKAIDLKPGRNDVGRLAPGVYFVQEQAQAHAVRRVVIQR
jgi:hypothetical protein